MKRLIFSPLPIFWLLLALALLFPKGSVAHESAAAPPAPAAPTAAPAPALPHLADLIPLATALSDRFAELEAKLKRGPDPAALKNNLTDIATRLTKYAAELDTLKSAEITGGGQLARLQAQTTSEGDVLATANKSLTNEVRGLVDVRNEWLAERKRWQTWRTALLTDEPLAEIIATFDTADRAIDTALQRITQQLQPLLALQEQTGTLQSTLKALTTAVSSLGAPVLGDTAMDAFPPIFSAAYVSQVQTGLRQPLNVPLDQIVQGVRAFWARQGWIVYLQGVLALVLVLPLVRHRQLLADSERWRFVAHRPIATGLFASLMLGALFYSGPPISVVFAYTLVGGIAFARLVADLAGPGWRTQRVYGLITFVLLTRLFYMLNVATPFLRLYILVAALLSLIWCLCWATKLASGRDAPRSAWGLGMTAAFFLIVVCMELWGGDALGGFLFTSALRTLILLPGFRLLQHLIQGGVEWAVNTSFLHAISLVRRNAGGITQRLSRLVELLVGVLLVTDLLVVWGVYASPSQALAAILGWSLSSGAQPMTVGDGVAAVGVVYVAVLVSWLVQQLLLDETLTTRDMERATRQAVARLVHYSLILVGFILALIVLGVDLTKVTLLASALGIGVGLAAKDLLASFFGGLMIYLDRPFAEGDWIRSPDRELEGTVEQIGVRLTRIRTFDQRPLYVPNSIFSTTVIENPSRMWNRRIYETIGIRYDDIDKMAGIVHDVEQMLRAHPEIDTTRTLMVNFTTFAASSLDFFIYTFTKTTNWQQYHKVKQDVLLRIAEIIAAHGAEIAFPTSTVYVPNGLFVQPDVAERR